MRIAANPTEDSTPEISHDALATFVRERPWSEIEEPLYEAAAEAIHAEAARYDDELSDEEIEERALKAEEEYLYDGYREWFNTVMPAAETLFREYGLDLIDAERDPVEYTPVDRKE